MVPLEDASTVSDAESIAGSPPPDDPQGAWTRLWRSGVLHSCATAIDGNYDGPVRAFWQSHFVRLPDGGVVVDVGTGNGALALLAMDTAHARRKRLEVHGVDLADISPSRAGAADAGAFEGIDFHPCTSLTALPFADGGIDLLVSQFAFEYAPREAAIVEALRVLGRRGAAAMVLHSNDSLVARVSAERLPWFGHLLHGSPMLASADAVVDVLAHARTQAERSALAADPRAEATRAAFNDAAGDLLERAAEPGAGEVLGRFMPALSQAVRSASADPLRARQALDALRQWLRDEEERLMQLHDALLGASELEALADRFRSAGHAVACGSLEQRPGAKLGWTLEIASRG